MIMAVVENRTLSILAETFAATVAAKDTEHRFHAFTHFPERRTLSELEGLAERLNGFAAYMVELWEQAKLPLPEAELEAFARRHVEITAKYWAAEGRCMNWFITGPARFPVARNEKRMRVSDARRADNSAHIATAKKAVKRKAFLHGTDNEPIRSGDPAAMQRIASRIEDLALSIDRMKRANVIIRRMEKDQASEADILARVVAETGMDEERASRGVTLPHGRTDAAFPPLTPAPSCAVCNPASLRLLR